MKIFLIGSGPAVEGQVTARAVCALKELGHQVVLLEPNPTSLAEADRTYLEPLTAEAALRVIAAEQPDAILAGIGRASTELALQLEASLGDVKWLGPTPAQLALVAPADAGSQRSSRSGEQPLLAAEQGGGAAREMSAQQLVIVAGGKALGQIEQRGDTWVCPAPNPQPELDAAAVKALADVGFTGCARVFFVGGKLQGIDPVVGAASAFASRALGVSLPRLAVRLALGLGADEQPKPDGVAVRRVQNGVEVMAVPNAAPPVAPGKSVVILGASGVEEAVKAEGLTPIVIDADPSALSCDVTRYYEPHELGPVLAICKKEQPKGVIVQLGGRAAVALAAKLEENGFTVLGTRPAGLERALDREQFAGVVASAGLQQPAQAVANDWEHARALAARIGFPLLLRSGPALTYVADEASLKAGFTPGVVLQAFLAEATQACVELLRDRTGRVVIAGVVEHVEQAGVHAADAACTLPPHSLKPEVVERLKDAATALAEGLGIVGLFNVHFALQGKAVWVLEGHPRATRTLPFVSKATGLDLPAASVRLMLGRTLEELGLVEDPVLQHCAVRESVFDENVQLGPTMRSTGAVMAVAESLAVAFGKSQLAAGTALPVSGTVFISVPDDDKPAVVDLAQRLSALGFTLTCTAGTGAYLQKKGVSSTPQRKVREGTPHVAEAIAAGSIAMVICAVGFHDYADCAEIRRAARVSGVPNFTTVEAARMAVAALEALAAGARGVVPLETFARSGR